MNLQAKLDTASIRRFGSRCVEMILQRTAWGMDSNGKPFKEYSTRPFKMPAGAVPKRAVKILRAGGNLRYFKNGKALWCVIIGGYAAFKKAIYTKTGYSGNVNLTLSGAMLNALEVIKAGNNTVRIGLTRTEEAQKAFWLKEKGFEFLGISKEELSDQYLTEIVAKGLLFS